MQYISRNTATRSTTQYYMYLEGSRQYEQTSKFHGVIGHHHRLLTDQTVISLIPEPWQPVYFQVLVIRVAEIFQILL